MSDPNEIWRAGGVKRAARVTLGGALAIMVFALAAAAVAIVVLTIAHFAGWI